MKINRTTLARLIFKIKSKATGNTRPGSYPYVTGDSFRELATHIHDETTKCYPDKVEIGDIVFVSNGYAATYMETIHKEIRHPYILIIHNGDAPVDKSVIDRIDNKIIRLYAQNATILHDKLIPIGIGLENRHYYMNGIPQVYTRLIKKIKTRAPLRKNKIFFRFNIQTNKTEREPAYNFLSKIQIAETSPKNLPPSKLINYKFIASPPGNGIEAHRTWEALYLKTIPIVKKSIGMNYLASLGLPIWIVDDWKILSQISEEDLSRKYDILMRNAVWEPLYMDFWIKMIKEDQKKARSY